MFRDVLSLLGRMGLRDAESRIYMVCLASDQGLFTHEIVKQTKLKRSTIDVMVKRLLQDGFLTKIKLGRRFQFQAQKPESLLFRQEELVEDWRQVIPVLKRIHTSNAKTEVLFFEGADGLQQVLDDILLHMKLAPEDKKEILALASGAEWTHLLPDVEKKFIAKRIKHGIHYRVLGTKTSKNVEAFQNNPKKLRRAKFIDDRLSFIGDIQIYADNVSIYSLAKPVGGVIIRNPALAASLRSLLDFVWDLVP